MGWKKRICERSLAAAIPVQFPVSEPSVSHATCTIRTSTTYCESPVPLLVRGPVRLYRLAATSPLVHCNGLISHEQCQLLTTPAPLCLCNSSLLPADRPQPLLSPSGDAFLVFHARSCSMGRRRRIGRMSERRLRTGGVSAPKLDGALRPLPERHTANWWL